MVRRAVNYLGKSNGGAVYSEPERVLGAYALLKAGEPDTHRVVEQARRDCLKWCGSDDMIENVLDSIYEVSVVGIFLCELDPVAYKPQITRLIKTLEKRQKECGGWGYPKTSSDWLTGDTSMTQYAILFAWTADATGAASMSSKVIRNATDWLLRTQDPTGIWGYQGKDDGTYRREKQSEVRPSLGVAGAGSLYICSAMLGYTSDQMEPTETKSELPPALTLLAAKVEPTAPVRTPDDWPQLKKGIKDGNYWFDNRWKNHSAYPKPDEYTMYYLYILERYQSFRDAAKGRFEKDPNWYNLGVAMLEKNQQGIGAWDFPKGNGKTADTAFALLFLVRSTQTALVKHEEFGGLLVAGRGIPSTKGTLKMEKGQIVRTPFQSSTSSLLDILENEQHPDYESLDNMIVTVAGNPKALAIQQKRMRRLARSENFKTRLVAVRTLSKMHDLDNVPILIYALTDPDARVVVAARDGLRFVSRKFTGFGLSDEPSKEELERAIEKWKKWYREIRPDARFED